MAISPVHIHPLPRFAKAGRRFHADLDHQRRAWTRAEAAAPFSTEARPRSAWPVGRGARCSTRGTLPQRPSRPHPGPWVATKRSRAARRTPGPPIAASVYGGRAGVGWFGDARLWLRRRAGSSPRDQAVPPSPCASALAMSPRPSAGTPVAQRTLGSRSRPFGKMTVTPRSSTRTRRKNSQSASGAKRGPLRETRSPRRGRLRAARPDAPRSSAAPPAHPLGATRPAPPRRRARGVLHAQPVGGERAAAGGLPHPDARAGPRSDQSTARGLAPARSLPSGTQMEAARLCP